MPGEEYVNPSRDNFETFKALPRDEPLHMLNLVRFRDWAQYPADHPSAELRWSGRRADAEYGRTSAAVFQRVGGSIVWRGGFRSMVIGPESETWDIGFVAYYPSASAFLEMLADPDYKLADPDYKDAVVNRTAAVQDSRLERFQPGDADQIQFG